MKRKTRVIDEKVINIEKFEFYIKNYRNCIQGVISDSK